MELALRNPEYLKESDPNIKKITKIKFTKSSSGLFVYSANHELVHYVFRPTGQLRIAFKWKFVFKSDAKILFIGQIDHFFDPSEVLIVTQELEGVVLYKSTSLGLEEFNKDPRFVSIANNPSVLVGRIFENSDANPGVLLKNTNGSVRIFALDGSAFENEEEFPFFEIEVASVPPEVSTADEIRFENGWQGQEFIIAITPQIINVFRLNSEVEFSKIGGGTIPLVNSKLQMVNFLKSPNKIMMVQFENSLVIAFAFDEGRKTFERRNYFYAECNPMQNFALAGPNQILLPGPSILSLNSSGFLFDDSASYWPHHYVKPLLSTDVPTNLIFEQDRKIQFGALSLVQATPSSNLFNFTPLNQTRTLTTPRASRNSTMEISLANEKSTEGFSTFDRSILDDIQLPIFLEESLRAPSGQVAFSFELLNAINFKLNYSPESNSDKISIVGKHWEIESCRTFIAVDPGGTHFRSDRKYFLIMNSKTKALEKLREEGRTIYYKTDEDPMQKFHSIIFNISENTWTVQSDLATMRFGGNESSLRKEILVVNWKPKGTSTKETYVHEWHLTTYENSITEKILHYHYIEEKAMTSDDYFPYTKKTHLKQINSEGMQISFDIGPETDFLLKGYEIQSVNYHQKLRFSQDNFQNGRTNLNVGRILTKISQQFQGSNWVEIFKFSYDSSSSLLRKIEIPTWKTAITYKYSESPEPAKPQGKIRIQQNLSLEEIHKETAVVTGQGLSIFAHANQIHFYKVQDGSLTSLGLEENLSKTRALAMEQHCVFLINGNTLYTFCCLPEEENLSSDEEIKLKWQRISIKTLPLLDPAKAMMTRSGTLLFQPDEYNLSLYQWNFSSKSWQIQKYSVPNPIRHLRKDEKFKIFAWLDDLNNVYYITGTKTLETIAWSEMKSYALSSRTNCGGFFDTHFDLGPEGANSTENYMKNMEFALVENSIALHSCDLQGWKTFSVIDILSLDPKSNVQHHQLKVEQEDIEALRSSFEGEDDKRFTIRYEKSGGEFLTTLELEGEEDQKEAQTKDYRDAEKNNSTKRNLINYGLYGIRPTSGKFLVGENKSIILGSQGWEMSGMISESDVNNVDLELNKNGDKLKFSKDGEKSHFEIRDIFGKTLMDMGSFNYTNLGYFYPQYIAADDLRNGTLNLWRFPGNSKITGTAFLEEEIASTISGPQVLVSRSTKIKNSDEIILRSTPWNLQKVLSSFEVQSGDFVNKVTNYEYTDPILLLTGSAMFRGSRTLPGKIPKLYGWIQNDVSFVRNGTKIKASIVDGFGNFVEDVTQEDQNSKNKNSKNPQKTDFIFNDKSGKVKITDFTPYKLNSCQTAFIAFEDYEPLKIHENCPQWELNMANVVKNSFSFTGRNFFRLQNHTVISLNLDSEGDESYFVSSWIKAPENLTAGDVTEILSARAALLPDQEILWTSKVIMTSGPWSLLQMEFSDYDVANSLNNTHNARAQNSSRIQIKMQNVFGGNLDIDHILLAPVVWSAEVFIHDPVTLSMTETIQGRDGLVVRERFSYNAHALVQINPAGEVPRFRLPSSSKVNSAGLRSTFDFETTHGPGWYENCDTANVQSLYIANPSNFKVLPGKIFHQTEATDDITLHFDYQSSLLFRFGFKFTSPLAGMTIDFFGIKLSTTRKSGSIYLQVQNGGESYQHEIEIFDENSLTLVLLDQARFVIFLEGELLHEKYLPHLSPTNNIKVQVENKISMMDMIFLPDPSLKVTYSTLLKDQDIQMINVESATSILVSQRFFDDVGRVFAETKKTIITSTGTLLNFRQNFAIPKYLPREGMTLFGEVNKLNPEDKGYAFHRIRFQNHVFRDEWESEGMCGKDYNIGGKFEKKYSTGPYYSIRILFPPEQGYRYKVTRNIQGYEETTVYTGKGKESVTHAVVAVFPYGEQLLSTYEYDFHGNLISAKGPEFHRRHETFGKFVSFKQIKFTDDQYENKRKYDGMSRLIEKTDVDGGVTNYVYDEDDNCIFTMHRLNASSQIDTIVYSEYSHRVILTEIGILRNFNQTAGVEHVLSYNYDKIPKKIVDSQPSTNAFIKTEKVTSKSEGQEDFTEVVDINVFTGNIISRRQVNADERQTELILKEANLFEPFDRADASRFVYNARGSSLLEYRLPGQTWSIRNKFNIMGKLIAVDFVDNARKLRLNVVKYTYTGSGHVAMETLSDIGKSNALTTKFEYNSPGFPFKQSNELVEESMYYEDEGYGGYSLGRINAPMTSEFIRLWSNPYSEVVAKKLNLPAKLSARCIEALERKGFLKNKKIQKIFHPLLTNEIPLSCKVGAQAEILAEAFAKEFIQQKSFQFKYQYGPYQDLIKAKFTANEGPQACAEPLTPLIFTEKLSFLRTNQTELWEHFHQRGFLVIDKQLGTTSTIHATNRKSFLNEEIASTLRGIGLSQNFYVTELVECLAKSPEVQFSTEKISGLIQNWQAELNVDQASADASKVFQFLSNHTYISHETKPTPEIFSPQFTELLKQFYNGTEHSFKIYNILQEYFNCAIGTHPFDFQVYDQDANGNFKLIYNGGKHLEYKYHEGTNKISEISITETGRHQTYKIGHDPLGNLNHAPHQGIELITYDPVIARPLNFKMSDGREIKIRYDHRGERISKEVFDSNGRITKRIKYLMRDKQERCLVEDEEIFVSPELRPKVTTTIYVYGERGLVGFHRRGKFYNVYTDNIGSVRFVLLNGEVVASYDYLPYGNVMSEFQLLDDAKISYRFTGQEFDPEFTLYNFHARIYDPLLGRFYQMDPKEQFFSPYKYGGNSPLNVIDPDGKLVIEIICAFVFAYIAASTAWGKLAFWKWDWTSPKTYIALITGAISGAVFSGVLAASFSWLAVAKIPFLGYTVGSYGAGALMVTTGIVKAYFLTAASNKEWKFWEWKNDLNTYGSIFQGFTMGITLFGGGFKWVEKFGEIGSKWWKGAFVIGSVGGGIGIGYVSTASAQGSWNTSNWKGEFAWITWTSSAAATFLTAGQAIDGVKYYGKQLKVLGESNAGGFWNLAGRIVKNSWRVFKQNAKSVSKEELLAAVKIIYSVSSLPFEAYISMAAATSSWALNGFNALNTAEGILQGLWSGWLTTSKPWGKVYNWKKIKKKFYRDTSEPQPSSGRRGSDGASNPANNPAEGGDQNLSSQSGRNVGKPIVDAAENLQPAVRANADLNTETRPAGGSDVNTESNRRTGSAVDVESQRQQNVIITTGSPPRRNVGTSAQPGSFSSRDEENPSQRQNQPSQVEETGNAVESQTQPNRKIDAESSHTVDSGISDRPGSVSSRDEENLSHRPNQPLQVEDTIGDVESQTQANRRIDAASAPTADLGTSIRPGTVSSRDEENTPQRPNLPTTSTDIRTTAGSFNTESQPLNQANSGRTSVGPLTTESVRNSENTETNGGNNEGEIEPTGNEEGQTVGQAELAAIEETPKTYETALVKPPFYFYNDTETKRTKRETVKHGISNQLHLPVPSSSGTYSGILLNVVRFVRDWTILPGQQNIHKQQTLIISRKIRKNSPKHHQIIRRSKQYAIQKRTFIPERKLYTNHFKQQQKQSQGSAKVQNCLPYLWLNGEYNLEGFTCTTQHGFVQVFPKNQPSIETKSLVEGYQGDDFENCQFLHNFRGQKSAFCEGRWSNMIYTSDNIRLPFDGLNDQLLLALLGLNLWHKIWTDEPAGQVAPKLKLHPEEILILSIQIDRLKSLSGRLTDVDHDFYVWTNYFLDDAVNDLEYLKKHGDSKENFERLEQTLMELESEIESSLVECGNLPNAKWEQLPKATWWDTIASYFA